MYLKVRIPAMNVSEDGRVEKAVVRLLETDIPVLQTDALQIVLHALAAPCFAPQQTGPFILDQGQLDSEMWLLG